MIRVAINVSRYGNSIIKTEMMPKIPLEDTIILEDAAIVPKASLTTPPTIGILPEIINFAADIPIESPADAIYFCNAVTPEKTIPIMPIRVMHSFFSISSKFFSTPFSIADA